MSRIKLENGSKLRSWNARKTKFTCIIRDGVRLFAWKQVFNQRFHWCLASKWDEWIDVVEQAHRFAEFHSKSAGNISWALLTIICYSMLNVVLMCSVSLAGSKKEWKAGDNILIYAWKPLPRTWHLGQVTKVRRAG
jgi:hypothetical protein